MDNNQTNSSDKLVQKQINTYVKSYNPWQRVVCAQGNFYVYSNAKISKATFDDCFFRELTREQYFTAFNIGNGGFVVPKILSQLIAKRLVSYIVYEAKNHNLVVQLAFEL